MKKKLCITENPCLETFNHILEVHQQAQLTVRHMSFSKPTSTYKVDQSQKKSQSSALPKTNLSQEEIKRRKIYKGKCSRCAVPDHMILQCKYPFSSVTCNTCKQPGHISPACARSVLFVQKSNSNQQSTLDYLPITYAPDGAAYLATSYNGT